MKLSRPKREKLSSATITQTLALVLLCSGMFILTSYAADPGWWSSSGTGTEPAVHAPQVVTNDGVVTTNYVPNPYAVVTQGQLKQFTVRAVDELNGNLPGGAGTNLNSMVSNWASDYATHGYNSDNIKPSDYTAMNVGQLKYIGNKVWSQLVAAGYTNAVPTWLQRNINSDNSVANLGQLKEVFDFDLSTFGGSNSSGVSFYAWELEYLGATGNNPNSLDPSGDGLTLRQAWEQGINPNDFYHGELPVLQLVGGDHQVGSAGEVLPDPLVVRVENQEGQALTNAPVQFAVTQGDGQIATTSTGSLSGSIDLRTDTNGLAQAFLSPAGSTGTVNQVQVAAATGGSSASVTFNATVGTLSSVSSPTPGGSGSGPVTDPDASPLATTVITITPFPYVSFGDDVDITATDDYTHITISWTAVTGADSYEVDRVDDLGTHVIYTGSGVSCTDSGLFSGINYQYQVHAIAGAVQSEATYAYSVPLIAAIAIEFQGVDGSTAWEDYYFSPGEPLYNSGAYPDYVEGDSAPIAYRFILNPSRTSGTITWYDGYSDDSYSSSTTAAATDIIADGTDGYDAPTFGTSTAGGGIISGAADLVLVQALGAGFYESGNNPETISWTGPGSSHFSVMGPDDTGDNVPYTSGETTSVGPFLVFTVTPDPDTVQPGDQIIITIADLYLNTSTVTYTYEPSPAPDYSMSIDEASGPKYRKIALNGLPMPDEKPQQTGETDQEQEETYVDALTIGLRHSTTDVYLPVSGSDFSVSARRDFRPEVWNIKSGLRPHEEPDRPFGMCWSSNLSPNIQFVKSNDPQKSQPDQAIVTDETGAVHTFYIWPASGGTLKFFPMPTAKNEQQTPNLESLTQASAGSGTTPATYTFIRKYGSTLTYTMTPLTLTTAENRYQGSTYTVANTYARLTQAVDHLGNTLNYTFNQANDLVPETITVANQPATTISIRQQPVSAVTSSTSTQNVITAIWDANGNKTCFHYTQATPGDTSACYLDTVTTSDGATTKYTYDIARETDTTPQPAEPIPPPFWHADLASITDPLNKTYTFTYALDQSKDDYMNNPSLYVGYYTKCGLPRNIATVTLPDGTSSSFVNSSVVAVGTGSGGTLALANVGTGEALTFPGHHSVVVTDATNFARTYEFGTPQIVPLPAFKTLYSSGSMNDSKIIAYKSLTITYGTFGSESFQFDLTAAMALSQITDFSGNITTFVHGDAWSAPTDYRTIMTDTTINGYYGDPTSQTDALGHPKTFTYYGANRIMQSSTDENGNKTWNDIDSLNRRTSEKIYDPSSNLVQETDFTYGSSSYPGFMTKKCVKALGGSDPSWTHALVTQYVPDGNGRVAQEIVDPNGLDLVTTYTYDANGNKLTATDPKGNITWFSYDSRNRLVTVTYADGSQKQTVYDARGNKVKEYDENGIATLYQYDSLNRLLKQARDMNGNGVIDAGTDLVTSYTYNAANSKLTTTDPNGGVTTMAYDSLQRVTQITDALSNITQFTYGANSGGNAFDSSGFKPTHTVDPREFTTDVTYDALYRPTAKAMEYAVGLSSTTSTEYDNVGNPILVTDPLGNQAGTSFDALNRPLVVTYADSTTSHSAYTSTGFKWQVIDPNGNTTRTTYDNAGRAIAVTAGYGTSIAATTTTAYDAAGNVAETVNPLLNKWDYAYDARNRKVQEFEPSALDATSNTSSRPTTEWAYDPAGRVTATIDARGNETDSVYDAANRVTDVNQPAVTVGGTSSRPNTHTTYDFDGNVHTLRDPNSNTTTNTYDALNRLLTSTDALSITVTNTYDQVGNKLTVEDGNSHTTSFAYDGLNRNTTVTDAAGNVTTLTYDALNKTGRTDALGQATTYSYDVRNRLSNVTYASTASANSQRNYAYDNDGNLLSVTEPSKTVANVAYAYDALNRVVAESSNGITHAYAYDLAGNRIQALYGAPSVGTPTTSTATRILTSIYDKLNRLSTLTDQTAAEFAVPTVGRTTYYGYDLNGNIVQKIAPNGDIESETFDALNRSVTQNGVTSVLNGSVSLYNFTYGYDLAGNVLTVGETYPSGLSNRTVTNTYDAINRLLTETVTGTAPNAVTTYAYDAANNRTSKVITGTGADSISYTYNNLNQPTSYGDGTRSVALTYDADGNRSTRVVTGGTDNGTDTYSYDFENRLIGLVKGTGGGTGTYAYSYDYRTRRIVRDESLASGAVTDLVFSGGTSVQEYSGSTSTLQVEYVRGSDYGGGVGGILYTIRSGTPSYTHANRKGDVIAKTDGSGNLTFQDQYDDNGDQVATNGSTQDRQKDNSKDVDPWGGIDEGNRYSTLEDGLRVFLTRDPAGFIDGPNLYTYCEQNPATKFDPEGLADEEVVGSSEDDIDETGAGLRDPERDENGQPIFGSEEYEKENPPPSQAPSGPTVGNGPGQIPPMNLGPSLLPPQGPPETEDEIALDVAKEMEAEKSKTPGPETQKQETDDNKAKTGDSTPPTPQKSTASDDETDPKDRGRDSEKRVLSDTGNVKNTKTYSTSHGDTIPDYENDEEVGDVKDTQRVNNTKQMRAQREVAQQRGKIHSVRTGTNTKVSRPMQNSGTKIIRRDDLGPTKS